MASLLIRDLDTVVTCDDADSVLRHVDLYCEDGRIRAIGPDLAVQADEVLDAPICCAIPASLIRTTIFISSSRAIFRRYRILNCSPGSRRSMRSGKTSIPRSCTLPR